MKYRYGMIFYVIALILEPFFYNLFPFFSANANLLFCIGLTSTFMADNMMGWAAMGCVFAIIKDAVFGIYIGPSLLAIIVVFLLIWLLKYYMNTENYLNLLLITLISNWAFASVYWVAYHFAGSPYGYVYAMKSLGWQLLLNCIVTGIFYVIVIRRKAAEARKDRYFR